MDKKSFVRSEIRSIPMRFVRDNLRSFSYHKGDCKPSIWYAYLKSVSQIQKEHEQTNTDAFSSDLAFSDRLSNLAELIIQQETGKALEEVNQLIPIVTRWVAYDYTRFYGDMS